MHYLLRLMFFFIYIHAIVNVHSQVTIGSGIEPAKGVLLQLKEEESAPGNPNATKGLMLPRVNLTDKNKLYPMFDSPGNPSYTNPADIAQQNSLHIGLLVFNVNRCTPFGKEHMSGTDRSGKQYQN